MQPSFQKFFLTAKGGGWNEENVTTTRVRHVGSLACGTGTNGGLASIRNRSGFFRSGIAGRRSKNYKHGPNSGANCPHQRSGLVRDSEPASRALPAGGVFNGFLDIRSVGHCFSGEQ